MSVYIYESHLGGLYVSDEYEDLDSLYCEQCGDSDRLLSSPDSLEEVREFLLEHVALFGNGGYSVEECEEIYSECAELFGEDGEQE